MVATAPVPLVFALSVLRNVQYKLKFKIVLIKVPFTKE